MQRPNASQRPPQAHADDLREFLLVLRRALLMITAWIERKYQIGSDSNT